MSTLWSGRFPGAPDEDVFRFGASFRFDRRLFEDDVTGSLAWADALWPMRACCRQPRATRSPTVCARCSTTCAPDPALLDANDEDVHSFVERQLVARVGEAGKRLHTGRSRNEQVALDMRLYLRRRIPALQALAVRAIAACVSQRLAGRRRADAGLHAPAARAADSRHALLAGARERRSGATTCASARPATRPG